MLADSSPRWPGRARRTCLASRPHLGNRPGLGGADYEIVKVAPHLETARLLDPADLYRLEAGGPDQPPDFLPGAVVAADNRDALQGADAVVLALRFTVLSDVIGEIADQLADRVVIVPSNPVTADAQGHVSRVLPAGQSSGKAVAGWLPPGAHLAMAFGSMSADLLESASNRSPEPAALFYATDDDRAGEEVERLIRAASFEPVKAGGIEQSGRLEVGGDLHDLVVGPAEARSIAQMGAARGQVSRDRPGQ